MGGAPGEPDSPAATPDGAAELLAGPAMRLPLAETGRPLDELLAVLERAAGVGLNPSSPATSRSSPAAGCPRAGGGILTSGGSLATFSAIVTARHGRLGQDFTDGTLYVTDQTHAAVAKSARLDGFPVRAVRVVDTDAELRTDVDALHGVAAFRAALDEKIDLAAWAADALAAEPTLHVLGTPVLTVVASRVARPASSAEADDEATATVLQRVNAERRVPLSSTGSGDGSSAGSSCSTTAPTAAVSRRRWAPSAATCAGWRRRPRPRRAGDDHGRLQCDRS